MSDTKEKVSADSKAETDKGRREFLRKSVYTAYATPVIMSLLVEKASAAQSWNKGEGNQDKPGTGNGGPSKSSSSGTSSSSDYFYDPYKDQK